MGIYDLLMLAALVGSILFGLWKGLAWQVASLASIFVSYFLALNFSGWLSGFISAAEPWNRFAAMLLIFLGTSLVIWMGYGYMKSTIERLRLRGFDTQAGAILGAFKGILLCMLITLFAVTLFGTRVRSAVVASKSGGYIATAINRFNTMVPFEIHSVLDPHVQNFNQNLVEQEPGFLAESSQKFEEKLQTFRGQFQMPNSRTAGADGMPFEQQGVYSNAGQNTNFQPGSTNNFQPPETRTVGDELFDAAKEAGRGFINDNFNR